MAIINRSIILAFVFILLLWVANAGAGDINLSGWVGDVSGVGVAGVEVSLKDSNFSTTTDSAGNWSLVRIATTLVRNEQVSGKSSAEHTVCCTTTKQHCMLAPRAGFCPPMRNGAPIQARTTTASPPCPVATTAGSAFNYVGNNGYWWSATPTGSTSAYFRYYMYYSYANVGHNNYGQTFGFSVRCSMDQ